MAELTLPSRRRRALAEALSSMQGPAPQMVGNQMAYNANAGLLSGLAQGIGGYLQGKEYAAADAQDAQRREIMAGLLGGPQVSGGASGTGEASPSESPGVRPASSTDYRGTVARLLASGDQEGAAQVMQIAKLFGDQGSEYFQPENLIDPTTGKVFGGQYGKDGRFRKLPYPIYKAPSSSFDPVSGSLIQTGGLPLEMIEGYAPPSAAPAAPGAPATSAPPSSRVIDLSGGKETPAAKKLREDAERARRSEQREDERLRMQQEEAGGKKAEKDKKLRGAQVNFEMGTTMLGELESLIKTTPASRLLDPTSRENAKAKSLTTQLGDIYRSSEFADLGVINPADVPRIEAVVADPTSWRGALQGKDSQLERINQMREMLKGRRRLLFGETPPEAPKPAKPAIGKLRIE